MNGYKKWLIAALLISVSSTALIVGLTFESKTIDALKSIRLEYILAASLFHILAYLTWSVRFRTLCKALGYRVNFVRSIEITLSSAFAAAITPASAGGEPLRIHLLHTEGVPLGKATAIVIGERLLDAVFTLTSLPFALYIMRNVFSNCELDAVFLTAILLVLIILAMFLFGVWKPAKLKTIIYFLTDKLSPILGKRTDSALSQFRTRLDMEIDFFHKSVRTFFKEGKTGLVLGIAYTILFWLLDFMPLILILKGLSQTPPILTAISAQIILAIILIVPATPGASGVAELGAVPIFSTFVAAPILGVTVLAWRAVTYHMNLLIGGIISLKVLKDMDLIKKLTGNPSELKQVP